MSVSSEDFLVIKPVLRQIAAAAFLTAVTSVANASDAIASDIFAAKTAENEPQLIAVAPGIRHADPAIQQAVDYLSKSDLAVEVKNRRRNTRPAYDSKVVKNKFNPDKVLILGSDVVPM